MLESYYQNSDSSMTKDTYFEMCEMLGSEPVDSEIPVDLEDFPDLIQLCFIVYGFLPDRWDAMGGNFLGKDYTIVFDLFDVYSIDTLDRLLALTTLQQMDVCRSKIVSNKLKQKSSSK
jgi:hypothetical protein